VLPSESDGYAPEDIYPALSEAYNAGDLEALVSLYDPKAVFVIKPGRVTESPAKLHGAMKHLVALRGRLTVNPRTFIRSDDLVLLHALWPPDRRAV
jgi:ketosteroid isomerase-like protein